MDLSLEEFHRTLIRSGWFEGRCVDTSAWRAELEGSGFVLHEAAELFLSEYGGLSFEYAGSGITRAREDFDLDPLLCLGEEGRFDDWSKVAGVSLSPLGEIGEGSASLGMDEAGTIYVVVDWLARFASGSRGMQELVLGVMPETVYDYYPTS